RMRDDVHTDRAPSVPHAEAGRKGERVAELALGGLEHLDDRIGSAGHDARQILEAEMANEPGTGDLPPSDQAATDLGRGLGHQLRGRTAARRTWESGAVGGSYASERAVDASGSSSRVPIRGGTRASTAGARRMISSSDMPSRRPSARILSATDAPVKRDERS